MDSLNVWEMEKALSCLQKMDMDFHLYTGKVMPRPLENLSLPTAQKQEMAVPRL